MEEEDVVSGFEVFEGFGFGVVNYFGVLAGVGFEEEVGGVFHVGWGGVEAIFDEF